MRVCHSLWPPPPILTEAVELAPLRPVRHRMGKPYVKAYFKHFPISDPEEDQDDRNALYCLWVISPAEDWLTKIMFNHR